MRKASNPPVMMLSAILGAIFLWIVMWASDVGPSKRSDFTQVDVITVVLTALGVVIAVLTLFLAVLAIFGWASFRTILEEKFEHLFRTQFDANNQKYSEMLDQVLSDAKAKLEAQEVAKKGDDLPENELDLDEEEQ